MPGKALVVDANILVRAVLGRRVREIIEMYAEQASFYVPDVAYAEAEAHVPALVVRRGGDPEKAIQFLRTLRGLVDLIASEVLVGTHIPSKRPETMRSWSTFA